MTVIHSQTGNVEEPLATLEDQLSETSKDLLRQTAEAAFSQAPLKKRASWWWGEHVGRTLGAVFIVGIALGGTLVHKLR